MAIYQRGRIFPGKRGAAEDFFCKPKKHRKILFCGACCAGNKLSSGIAEKKAHLTRWGVLFGSGMPTRLRYQKDPRHKREHPGFDKEKAPHANCMLSLSAGFMATKKMSAKTRGNRQKKLSPERKLRPGSAWCEGETRGISSRFWSKLELPH